MVYCTYSNYSFGTFPGPKKVYLGDTGMEWGEGYSVEKENHKFNTCFPHHVAELHWGSQLQAP